MVQPGDRFGRLTVIRFDHRDKRSHPYYLCRCDCGNEKVIITDSLEYGKTQSCGCLKREKLKEIHARNVKSFGCKCCGSPKHYARGLCRNCYSKASRRGWSLDFEPEEKLAKLDKQESLEEEKKRVTKAVDELLTEFTDEERGYWRDKINKAKTSNEISRWLYDIREII